MSVTSFFRIPWLITSGILRPPKKGFKPTPIASADASGTTTPLTSLALTLSYAPPPHGIHPRPFKNPAYTKNVNRRARNIKGIISQEKEREAREREARRMRREGIQPDSGFRAVSSEYNGEQDADADGEADEEEADEDRMYVDSMSPSARVKPERPSESPMRVLRDVLDDVSGEEGEEDEILTYTSIEAPPSFMPQKHWCDITGLEAPYTDPATGLRYHDRNIYAVVKSLNMPHAKEYLAARGVSSVVK